MSSPPGARAGRRASPSVRRVELAVVRQKPTPVPGPATAAAPRQWCGHLVATVS